MQLQQKRPLVRLHFGYGSLGGVIRTLELDVDVLQHVCHGGFVGSFPHLVPVDLVLEEGVFLQLRDRQTLVWIPHKQLMYETHEVR